MQLQESAGTLAITRSEEPARSSMKGARELNSYKPLTLQIVPAVAKNARRGKVIRLKLQESAVSLAVPRLSKRPRRSSLKSEIDLVRVISFKIDPAAGSTTRAVVRARILPASG
eukprot:6060919-Prymnesium_polylepis.1